MPPIAFHGNYDRKSIIALSDRSIFQLQNTFFQLHLLCIFTSDKQESACHAFSVSLISLLLSKPLQFLCYPFLNKQIGTRASSSGVSTWRIYTASNSQSVLFVHFLVTSNIRFFTCNWALTFHRAVNCSPKIFLWSDDGQHTSHHFKTSPFAIFSVSITPYLSALNFMCLWTPGIQPLLAFLQFFTDSTGLYHPE